MKRCGCCATNCGRTVPSDAETIWGRCCRQMASLLLPETCPVTLDELLGEP